jgi:hypothetical protein
MRKFAPLLAGSVLLLALSLPAPSSLAATSGQTPAFTVTGVLTYANGRPAPRAEVTLYAWPSDATLHALKSHDPVPRKLLASALTGYRGQYSLTASAKSIQTLTQAGYVDAELVAGRKSVFLALTPTGGTTTVNLPGAGGPFACGRWFYQRQAQKAWAIVGQSYILASATHVTQTFRYQVGQVTTLGAGISGSDQPGTFRRAGTSTEYAKRAVSFSTRHTGNFWYETRFRIGLFARSCNGQTNREYLVRADGWAGGSKTGHPATAPATNSCVSISRGTSWTSGQESAVTWPSGLMVTSVGFTGPTRTGYDTGAEVVYDFSANRRICGTQRNFASSQQFVVER